MNSRELLVRRLGILGDVKLPNWRAWCTVGTVVSTAAAQAVREKGVLCLNWTGQCPEDIGHEKGGKRGLVFTDTGNLDDFGHR